MGFQCSILGHAFEDAGVERERTEQGSEVVTTEREIERCRRCGKERVVSESTEVAAVVDASDVGIDDATDSGVAAETPETGSGLSGAVDRSTSEDSGDALERAAEEPVGGDTDTDDADSGIDLEDAEASPPADEDAEILTNDSAAEPDRQPGQWPGEPAADDGVDDESDLTKAGDGQSITDPEDRPLSGITVPEGKIVCPDCSFSIEANSGYRAGDPCPNCNAWLEAERNQ
jgi:hypothetical protein